MVFLTQNKAVIQQERYLLVIEELQNVSVSLRV